ncbi:MAG: hypothetical protein GXY27_00105 [Erysipelotrichaceae bacterium]|nr:hypothetical protein [Erysipelotrichaceae bacterium]
MKKLANWLALSISLLSMGIFNPFWPIWGESYVADYGNGHFINITSSSLTSFLNNDHYSSFQHFSAIFSLVCLYLATAVLIVAIIISFAKKKDYAVIDYSLIGLLIVSSIFLPFTCRYQTMLFILYSFLPLVGGLMILIKRFKRTK